MSRTNNKRTAKFVVTKRAQMGTEDPERAVFEITLGATRDYEDVNNKFFGAGLIDFEGSITLVTYRKSLADFFQIGRAMYVDFTEDRR